MRCTRNIIKKYNKQMTLIKRWLYYQSDRRSSFNCVNEHYIAHCLVNNSLAVLIDVPDVCCCMCNQ